jgi:uncharacterized membrane protein YdbT with pleckstrin-like domain
MILSWSDIKNVKPLHEDEQIVLVTREHWIIPFLRILAYTLVIIFIWVIGWILDATVREPIVTELYHLLSSLLGAFLLLLFVIYFHNYYLSMQLVTTERIIDVDQKGLFHVEMNDAFLENIEAVNLKQATLWENIFNFGSVDVETAGSQTALKSEGSVFENIPNPRHVVEIINSLKHDAEKK